MTNRDTFFTREDYFQLLYGALRPEEGLVHHSGLIVTLPPAIVKPRVLWTGKQIVRDKISGKLYYLTPRRFQQL